jgi:hypothetical protein
MNSCTPFSKTYILNRFPIEQTFQMQLKSAMLMLQEGTLPQCKE